MAVLALCDRFCDDVFWAAREVAVFFVASR